MKPLLSSMRSNASRNSFFQPPVLAGYIHERDFHHDPFPALSFVKLAKAFSLGGMYGEMQSDA
jgi:hypothetical protein